MTKRSWASMARYGLLVLLMSAGCSRCGSAPTESAPAGSAAAPAAPAAAPAAKEPPLAPTAAPADEQPRAPIVSGLPAEATYTPMPEGTPTPDANKVKACESAIEKLAAGDLKALSGQPEGLRKQILSSRPGTRLVACVAAANGDVSACDGVPAEQKQACLEQVDVARGVKGAGRDGIKPYIIEKLCGMMGGGADCAAMRKAVAEKDAAACTKLAGENFQKQCTAYVTGNGASCAGLPDPNLAAYCAAISTDDASKCPNKSIDCQATIAVFVAAKKPGAGSAGLENIDPPLAAALSGVKACAPMANELRSFCALGQ